MLNVYTLVDESSSVKKMAVTLKRGPKGYGFSVNGFNPVYITRIQPGWSILLGCYKIGMGISTNLVWGLVQSWYGD